MDAIVERFRGIPFRYAPQDDAARRAMHQRIAEVGKRRGLITYSELVRGMTFSLPSLHEPSHRIDTADWQDLDRAIIGDFLGYISMESYAKAGFFASALVVSKQDGTPGKGFYELLKALELIADAKSDKATFLWSDHVAKAHDFYSAGGLTA